MTDSCVIRSMNRSAGNEGEDAGAGAAESEVEAGLAEVPVDLPDVHPKYNRPYRAKVIRLAESLAEPKSNGEAREDIRSLVGDNPRR